MILPACPKIDCHIHAIDPVRFPYRDDTPYRPSGQEIAPAAQLIRVLDVFDVRHALVVATNTGYGSDSRILLDTLRQEIKYFDLDGRYIDSFAGFGSSPGAIKYATAVSLDRNGRLCVADSGNLRVQVLVPVEAPPSPADAKAKAPPADATAVAP